MADEEPQQINVVKVTANLWATQTLLDDWAGLDLTLLREALEGASRPTTVPLDDKPNPAWVELIHRAEGDETTEGDRLAEELLALHRPEPVHNGATGEVAFWLCKGCDTGGGDSEQPDWPCSTVDMIQRHLDR